MRSLLAKEFNTAIMEPNDDHERLTRLFGSAKKDNIKRSRVLFSDMVLDNEQELRDAGLQSMTEVKFENSINRATAIANPRQIERVVRGSVFRLDLIYELENMDEFLEDMETLGEGMKLMEMYTRRYNLQNKSGWQRIYVIYRNRILIYLQQRPNIMLCSTVISKQTWEKLI